MMKVLIDGQTLATPDMDRGIGKVFRRLVDGMVVPDISRRWQIALPDASLLSRLAGQTADALEPIVVPMPTSSPSPLAGSREYAATLQAVIADARPDWYWNPNPLMVNVRYPLGLHGVRKAITLHDLIPLRLPDEYLNMWDPALAADYRARLQDIAHSASVVMPDSRTTARDFLESFPSSKCLIRPITLSSDFCRMRPLRCGAAMSRNRYFLFVGGFDPRKNMRAAIEAFAQFLDELPDQERDVRFKIVCAHTDAERNSLLQLARDLGVSNFIDLLGYVADEDLAKLIREAYVFFFPSKYEGFGLPALDALACGIPVVASGATSLPEVCGPHAFYCNPVDIGDMARNLYAAWEARKQRLGPWIENAEHARANFSWERTCDQYLEVLSTAKLQRRVSSATMGKQLRLAYLSPWPPQKSGVADYSYSVVGRLKDGCEVTVYTSASAPAPIEGVEIRSIGRFAAEAHRYDQAIYHIGNGEHHREIYMAACHIPGIVVIHDFNIHPFMHAFVMRTPQRTLYRDALLWYGQRGQAAWEDFERTGTPAKVADFAMSEPLIAGSRAVIVHSRWAARELEYVKVPIFPSHLGSATDLACGDDERRRARQALGLEPRQLYIGVFGFINAHKRIHVTIASVAELRAEGIPVVLVLVGAINDSRIDLEKLKTEHALGSDAIIYTDYVSEDEFSQYVQAVDVAVNLRYPTMGEGSASLFNAFARFVPTVVSNVNQFAELPDWATWKVDVGDSEQELLVAYLRHLLKNPMTRDALASNAHSFIRRFASFEKTAADYLRVAAQISRESG